jgi:uracil-DNA glycosylase family 4
VITDLRLAEGCRRCSALVANRRCIVHGYGLNGGRSPLRILFVGEAPGYKGADLTGVPFTCDRSGVRLQQALIELGLSEERDPRNPRPRLGCFVTNIVRCNPPSNRTPHRDEIENCLPYLWQEMDLLQPDVVVPIGNVAARAIFSRLAGEAAPPITCIHAQVVGYAPYLVPMRHPARISNADLARFVAVLHGLLTQGIKA